MFEQLQPEGWLSKVTLRLAIVNAIGWAFSAGMAFGILILKAVLLHATYVESATFLVYLVIALALAIRFYYLAMARAHEQRSLSQPR